MSTDNATLLALLNLQDELLKSYVGSQVAIFTLRAEVDALKEIFCIDQNMKESLRQQTEVESRKYEPALRTVGELFERWQADLLLRRKSLSTLIQ
ncbi:MAG TPA: hypothetical protein VGG72_28030 [Bryobacteraceae bacterium]|jgi:hypothetical protein